jgi:nucleotide-binding universal stress UspA family protein
MRKILVAFDGSVYAEGALEYAFYLGDKSNDIITGVFIEDLSYLNYINVFGEEYLPLDFEAIDELKSDAANKVKENIESFSDTCEEKGWRYDVHYNKGVPAYELIKESRFADLIVMGYQTFFSNVENLSDRNLLKDLLSDAESPVIAVPYEKTTPQQVVLTYNGKPSSMFAIKQFAYLLPRMSKELSTTCLILSSREKETKDLSKEYLDFHFKHLEYEKMVDEPNEKIISYTQSLSSPLLVMGSYGQNIFKRFFSTSVAEKIIKQQTIPIFIAHR